MQEGLKIKDPVELENYKRRIWLEFETNLRNQIHHLGTWAKYALWEAELGEVVRARSIFEWAIEVDYKNVALWLKYAEMEMKYKFVNHARNVWEWACSLMPRID